MDWRVNSKPVVTQIIVSTKRNYFNLNFSELNRNYATEFDPQTGMPINLAFPKDSISRFLFTFTNHVTVPYKMTLIKSTKIETDTTRIDFYFLDEEYNFNSHHFNTPGNYELVIEPVISGFEKIKEDQKLRFKFKVLPPPVRSYSIMEIASFAIAVLLFLLFAFSIYYLFNKRRLIKVRQQKEFVDLKLKSIQSQLNPHFMFNALSSIQNLMNKNDLEGANHYLGKFSGLTRKVLDTGENQMISLEDELKILDDYLQMEQLRFGFLYDLKVDNQINKANIEVPAMLLQPLVENAVKHGVSGLNNSGVIKITVSQNGSNLNLQVADNGTGFSEELVNGNSLGIKLVKERIKLLNQISKEHLIALTIDSGKNGTTIILKLENWV